MKVQFERETLQRLLSRCTFKDEGMGACVTAGRYRLTKEAGYSPKTMGFFVGNRNQVCTDVSRYLQSEKAQRILTRFVNSPYRNFVLRMPYKKDAPYQLKGLIADSSHTWREGAVPFDEIRIRMVKDHQLRIISIFPGLKSMETKQF